jgi:hypothetical protein
MFFRCKHPAHLLAVQSPETTERKNADFDVVTYHLVCRRCRTPVPVTYARMIGGVEAFLERGLAPVDA